MALFSNYSMFDPWMGLQRPSVYVISDSQLAEYKRNQAEAEVIELDKLIEGHEASMKRLKRRGLSFERNTPLFPKQLLRPLSSGFPKECSLETANERSSNQASSTPQGSTDCSNQREAARSPVPASSRLTRHRGVTQQAA